MTSSQVARLEASDGGSGQRFGHDVALHGERLVAGAPLARSAGGVVSGAAYVFARAANVWTETTKLVAPGSAAGDGFGFSVDLANDTVLIGAPGGDGGGPFFAVPDVGLAHLFRRDVSSGWTFVRSFAEISVDQAAAGGWDVALSCDVAVLNAPFADRGNAADEGAILRYVNGGGVRWDRSRDLHPRSATPGLELGSALDWDGRTLLVGVANEDTRGTGGGAVYFYGRQHAPLVFTPASGSPVLVPNLPRKILSADFGGGSRDDLCTVDGSNVRFWFNDGTGRMTAAPGSGFVVPGGVNSIVAGELDGRAGTDLAIASPNGVHLRLNDSIGGLTPAPGSPIPVGMDPSAVAIGDLDRGSGNDLVVADEVASRIHVLFNDGAGGFGPGRGASYVTGPVPRVLAVGDLDGRDGPDVVVVLDHGMGIEVFHNDGSGGLRFWGRLPGSGRPGAAALADLDGRNGLDLVVAGDGVRIHLNDGSGGLTAFGTPLPSNSFSDLDVADLDGDLDLDLALHPGPLLLMNDGGAHFQQFEDSVRLANSSNDNGCLGDFGSTAAPDLALLPGLGAGIEVVINGRATIGLPGRNLLRPVDANGRTLLSDFVCPRVYAAMPGRSYGIELQARAAGLETYLFVTPAPCVLDEASTTLPAIIDPRYRIPMNEWEGTNQIVNLPLASPGLAVHGPYLTVEDPCTGGGRVFRGFMGAFAGITVTMQAAIVDPTVGTNAGIVLTNAFQLDL